MAVLCLSYGVYHCPEVFHGRVELDVMRGADYQSAVFAYCSKPFQDFGGDVLRRSERQGVLLVYCAPEAQLVGELLFEEGGVHRDRLDRV